MMSSNIRKKFIEFYKARGHVVVPSASLVPENDPTTLFTSSGMQPLVPYLLGQPHPLGTRIVDSQKCFRAQDIEEVGDNRHTTFFEMLGNWSLGDYFKKEQLLWLFGFLTKELRLDPKRLYVSVFEGNASVPKDTESIGIWKEIFSGVGIEAKEGERIFTYPADKNWWSRAGGSDKMPVGEPGGPDSEVFFEFTQVTHDPKFGKACHPNCDCGRFLEVANAVFMQYSKRQDGSLEELPNKNVDFGGGLERLVAATEDTPDVFDTDLFVPIIGKLEELSGREYRGNRGNEADKGEEKNTRAMRIVADHAKAAVMMMADGVLPSNKAQGYMLRRLVRRSLLYGRILGFIRDFSCIGKLVTSVAEVYQEAYPEVLQKVGEIEILLQEEAQRFGKTLDKGLKEIEKKELLDGKTAFYLYGSYGFPWELTEEIARERGQQVDKRQFEAEFKKHQELSRTAAAGLFKGGLADRRRETVKLHTAHHLLLAALQKGIDPTIKQRGSNITAERLRMDFSFARKLTTEDIQKVQDLVNEQIRNNLPVVRVEMSRSAAERIGAQMEFGQKYPEQVSVYFVGLRDGVKPEQATPTDYVSAEFCGGPHAEQTGALGHFAITKEESAGAGLRRIYGVLRNQEQEATAIVKPTLSTASR